MTLAATLRVDFDSPVKPESNAAAVTSDVGLAAYRELNEAMGLTATVDDSIPRSSRGQRRESRAAQAVPCILWFGVLLFSW